MGAEQAPELPKITSKSATYQVIYKRILSVLNDERDKAMVVLNQDDLDNLIKVLEFARLRPEMAEMRSWLEHMAGCMEWLRKSAFEY